MNCSTNSARIVPTINNSFCQSLHTAINFYFFWELANICKKSKILIESGTYDMNIYNFCGSFKNNTD